MAEMKTLALLIADGKRLKAAQKKVATELGLLDENGAPVTSKLDEILAPDNSVSQATDSDFAMSDMTPAGGVSPSVGDSTGQQTGETGQSGSDTVTPTESKPAKGSAGRPKGIPQPDFAERMRRKRVKLDVLIVKRDELNKEIGTLEDEINSAEDRERERKAKLAANTVSALNPSLLDTDQIQALEQLLAQAKEAQSAQQQANVSIPTEEQTEEVAA